MRQGFVTIDAAKQLQQDGPVPALRILSFIPSSGSLHVMPCRLHAIDLTTGHEKNGSPSQILAASKTFPGQGVVTFDATKQLQRPGLTLAQARVLP